MDLGWETANLTIVSGPMGSGKTMFCRALAANLAGHGEIVSGFLQESVRDDSGIPTELRLSNIGTGETRFLALRVASPASGIHPPFEFRNETFAWALTILEDALNRCTGTIFVDEIGPLELEGCGGFRPFLDTASRTGTSPLVLTVRPSLEPALSSLFEGSGRPIRRMRLPGNGYGHVAESLPIDFAADCHFGRPIDIVKDESFSKGRDR